MMNSYRRKRVKNVFAMICIFVVCIIAVFPFFWMLLISFKNKIQTYDPSIWLFIPTLENYRDIITTKHIFDYAKNSLIIVIITTLLSLVLGSIAAYGFARFNFKKKESLAFGILSLRMIPPMATVIPFFVMARMLNVIDTKIVLIISYMLFNIPFTIWMMRGFFEEIPKEIEEAGRVDGCSHFKIFTKILLPLASSGLVATGIFCIINSWNELVFALFLTSVASRTLPTTVTFFLSVTGVLWGDMAAVGVLTALPVLIFAMIVQKYMIRGLTFGAVKG
jgi:multiple sugar transport system permease protein